MINTKVPLFTKDYLPVIYFKWSKLLASISLLHFPEDDIEQGLCQDSEAPTINEQTIQSEEKLSVHNFINFTTQP